MPKEYLKTNEKCEQIHLRLPASKLKKVWSYSKKMKMTLSYLLNVAVDLLIEDIESVERTKSK